MAALAEYFQRGEALDYLNETEETIEAGQIVMLGSHAGVAGCPIAPGMVGSLHVNGVFAMPKAEGEAIEAGADVSFDGETVSAAGESGAIGYAVQAAAADDETVKVKLLG